MDTADLVAEVDNLRIQVDNLREGMLDAAKILNDLSTEEPLEVGQKVYDARKWIAEWKPKLPKGVL